MLNPEEKIIQKAVLDMAKDELKKGAEANLDVLAKGFECYRRISIDSVQREYIRRATHPEKFGDSRAHINHDLWSAYRKMTEHVKSKKQNQRTLLDVSKGICK